MADFQYHTLKAVIDTLLGGSPGDAEIRSAGNRIYYCAYGTLRQKIVTVTQNDCFGKNGKHKRLVDACLDPKSPPGLKQIGVRLQSLLLLREESDYVWGATIDLPRVTSQKLLLGGTLGLIRMLGYADMKWIHDSLI